MAETPHEASQETGSAPGRLGRFYGRHPLLVNLVAWAWAAMGAGALLLVVTVIPDLWQEFSEGTAADIRADLRGPFIQIALTAALLALSTMLAPLVLLKLMQARAARFAETPPRLGRFRHRLSKTLAWMRRRKWLCLVIATIAFLMALFWLLGALFAIPSMVVWPYMWWNFHKPDLSYFHLYGIAYGHSAYAGLLAAAALAARVILYLLFNRNGRV